MERINQAKRYSYSIAVLLLTALAPIAWNNALAQVGTCPEGQYKYCDGDCPPEHTDQGECTTRIEQTPPARWCCCYNSYSPDDVGDQTTPGGPPTSIGDCPPPDDGTKPPESKPWAASAAIAKTADPKFTDNVLRLVRDNVLRRNERGQRYVKLVYRFSDDVEQILATNPSLVSRTTDLLTENLKLLMRLANGETITIGSRKTKLALALLDDYSPGAGENADLKRAIEKAREGLQDRTYLMSLGIRVTD